MTEAVQPYTLEEILGAGERVPLEPALMLIRATALAIDALHTRQATHGALSPSSVQVVGEAQVVLLSAGWDAAAGDLAASARQYWSPQRRAGEPVRPADDLYALGLIASALLDESLTEAAEPLPAEAQAVLQAQCSWAPSERFASGAEFARELDRAAALGVRQLPPSAREEEGGEGLAALLWGGGVGAAGQAGEPAWAAARRVALAREAHRLMLVELPDRGRGERVRTVARHPMQRPDYPDFPLPGGWVAVVVVVLCSVYLFPLYFMLVPHG